MTTDVESEMNNMPAPRLRRIRVGSEAVRRLGTCRALAFCQLVYWIAADGGHRARPAATHRSLYVPHVFKSARDLAGEVGLMPAQVERAIAGLRKRKIIDTLVRRFRCAPTNAVWLTPDGEILARAVLTGSAVSVVPALVRTFGSDGGLLLSQISYWFTRRREDGSILARRRDGQVWIAKTDAELAHETGLTVSQVRRCRRRLCEYGVIQTERRSFGEIVCNRYTLDEVRVADLLRPEESEPMEGEIIAPRECAESQNQSVL